MYEKSITLREFVSRAITEISEGLHEAQEVGRNKGVKIFPKSYGNSSTPTKIEFDLCVSSIAECGKEGNISIGVFSISMKGGESGKNALTSESRIRFTIPVDFVVYNPVDSKVPEPIVPERVMRNEMQDWL